MIEGLRAIPGIGDPGLFLPRLQRSIVLSPLILVGSLSLLLLGTGQMREALLRVVEPGNTMCASQLSLGLFAFLLLSATLFYSYLSSCVVLRKMGIGYGSSLIYESNVELRRDRLIVWIRDLAALACAAAPLMTIGYGFWLLSQITQRENQLMGIAAGSKPALQLCATDAGQMPGQLAHVALGWLALSVMFLLGLFLTARLELRRSGRLGVRSTRTRLHPLLKWISAITLLVPIPLINANAVWHVALFQHIGPLATLGLVLMATATLVFAIGEWSKKLGIPFFTITAIVVFVLGLYSWVRTTSQIELNAKPASADAPGEPTALEQKFVQWLKARQDADWRDAVPRQPYPVFILVAPGGGIYAASFVASAMARLERDCPGFSQHVFAISAVSGGAIGSASVNAAEQLSSQKGHVECRDISGAPEEDDPRMDLVRRVLSEDHLSPTLAATVPDTIVKLFAILLYESQRLIRLIGKLNFEPLALVDKVKGRAEALETSISEAFQRACREARVTACNQGNPLDKPFENHWQRAGAAPALVLNTTWAETGDRIAYAPFPLKDVGDRTLKSVSDLEESGAEVAEPANLVRSAIASARFPAVLPAMILRHPSGQRLLWWNFVDGGYADASGTTTGLEIYQALYSRREHIKESAGIPIDLKLVILTSAGTETDPRNPSGPGLIYAITPITTLLNVREQIGRRAVARAIKELAPDEIENASLDARACPWRVRRIVLDTASLPLGWMLSHYTAARIDRLMRNPDAAGADAPIAVENKATFSAIRDSLSGHCVTAQSVPN
jgi:hypothetical protein